MAYTYTVAQAIKDAKDSGGISAAMITTIMGELAKSKTHADAHMKSEDFWTQQRTGSDGTGLGTTATVDGHLKSAYAKRSAHSMFDSPVSAVEATAGALNCDLGVQALTALLGRTDGKGIDVYSRTAVLTLEGTEQFKRTSPDKGTTSSMNKVDAEYVVVCLRKDGTNLAIASAYPVASDGTSKAENAGKDWYQVQGDKTVVKAQAAGTATVVNW